MQRLLFLDDDKGRVAYFLSKTSGNHVTVVETADAAIRALQEEPRFDVAFLDHDLADNHYRGNYSGERTGMDVAKHIAEMDPDSRPQRVVVHSWNGSRGRIMVAILNDAGTPAVYVPFAV